MVEIDGPYIPPVTLTTDRTAAARQARRREELDAIAREVGWPSWGKFETAVKRREATIPPPNPPPATE